MAGHSPGIGLPYDPVGARELLAQAGYPGGEGFPVVEVLLFDVAGRMNNTNDTLRQYRENLGVEFALKFASATEFDGIIKREPPHLACFGWGADYPDPDNFLRVGLGADKEYMGWQGVAFDRIVEDASRIMDHGERTKRYQEADEMLIEEAVILPLSYGMRNMLVKPWVVNNPVSPMEHNFWKDVVIETH